MVLLIALVLGAGADAHARPDLVLPRAGLAREGAHLLITVENAGSSASPATELELSESPFLGGPTGTSSPYRPVRGARAVWVDQERAGGEHVRLALHLGGGSRGRITFFGTDEVRVDGADGGLARDGPAFAWDVPPGLTTRTFLVAARPGSPPRARLTVLPDRDRIGPPVHTSSGIRHGTLEIVLDCLDRPAARRARVAVPPLEPGARTVVEAVFPGGARDAVHARVDPEDGIAEVREGNNVTAWAGDRDLWTLAGLHLHSCFSEGSGSLDWQVWHAALSGYDLCWWSEHDWRVTCRDHLERLDFAAGGPARVDFHAGRGDARAEYVSAETAPGGRVLFLATGEEGGEPSAEIGSVRKRLAYALASDLDVSVRLRAVSLAPGDTAFVEIALGDHPGERRSLRYALTPGAAERSGGPPWAPLLCRGLPTAGWVTHRFPISQDARGAWPNGADANLLGIRVTLRAQAAAELRVERLGIAHRRCGADLQRIQREWLSAYPNLVHEIGGEVSVRRPHLGRYGGDGALVEIDLHRLRDDSGSVAGDVDDVVRRVHARSGLVSWCHPLGAVRSSRVDSERFLDAIRDGLGGVDAVEIGYRSRAGADLAEYLALWDRVSAEGVVVTALAVNDSHGTQWAPWENNLATWLAAPADDSAALLRALRQGRAFFGDPVRFRGRATIDVNGVPMGGIVSGEGARTARIRVVDAGEDRVVKLIGDGALLREWEGVSGTASLEEELPGGLRAVRAEVRTAAGEPLAFTNPVYLDRGGTLRRGRK